MYNLLDKIKNIYKYSGAIKLIITTEHLYYFSSLFHLVIMSDDLPNFSNPENLPLEELMLPVSNGGVMQQIKALDPHWAENRELTIYETPPTVSTTVIGAVDAWINKMKIYLDDLQWLLRLPQHRFWSTVLYHPRCMDALVSFLQEARPPYLPAHENKEVEKLYMEIRRLVFIIFSRLITNKESKSQWMSREYMAGLIYDKFVFTIPILWDICLVYGEDNAQHVSRLLEAVFALQPRYEADAAAALAFVKETFKYIILQVNKDYGSDDPPNLPETFKGFSEIRRPDNSKREELTLPTVKDMVVHLLDTAMTLRIFLEVYPKSVQLFRDTNFIISAVQVYEYGVPPLHARLRAAGGAELEALLEAARADLIDIFREVLAAYKNAIFSGQGNIAGHVEDYLEVMMDGLSERLLIQDYHACYPLHEDLEMLKQAYPDIDPVKTDFILQAVYSNIDDTLPENQETNNTERLTNGHVERAATTIDNPQPGSSVENEIPTNVKEESLISEVKDILPHLGDGFVLKCLQHYGFNSARVINCILEDNLAEPLRGLDRSLPLIPEDVLDQKFLETGVERLNVFDGDQFDLMTRDDVDVSRIHVGKRRSKYRDLKDMLNDKTEVKKMADIYTKYNLVCEEESMYSDEYDDTYDESAGAEAVPRGDSRDDERRPLVTPRVLRAAPARGEESEEEEEREESSSAAGGSSRSRMDFCTNPEEVRARREANLQARRGRGHRAPPAKNVDVTGKPRGQGQDKEVLVNRERKEKHKSSRGNHSRRQGAQWKRSQGLVPS